MMTVRTVAIVPVLLTAALWAGPSQRACRAAPRAAPETHRQHLDHALLVAAERGDGERVRALLSQGASVNAAANGYTALLCATMAGDIPTMRILIDRGADVNAGTRRGITPLMEAASQRSPAEVALLLASGADVAARDGIDQTVMFYAYTPDVLAMLLQRGAAVNDVNKYRETPLMLAARIGDPALVRLLRARGGREREG